MQKDSCLGSPVTMNKKHSLCSIFQKSIVDGKEKRQTYQHPSHMTSSKQVPDVGTTPTEEQDFCDEIEDDYIMCSYPDGPTFQGIPCDVSVEIDYNDAVMIRQSQVQGYEDREGEEQRLIDSGEHPSVDRCYSWVVMAVSFVLVIIVDGIVRTFGAVLLPVILFDCDVQFYKISLVGSIMNGFYMGAGR